MVAQLQHRFARCNMKESVGGCELFSVSEEFLDGVD